MKEKLTSVKGNLTKLKNKIMNDGVFTLFLAFIVIFLVICFTQYKKTENERARNSQQQVIASQTAEDQGEQGEKSAGKENIIVRFMQNLVSTVKKDSGNKTKNGQENEPAEIAEPELIWKSPNELNGPYAVIRVIDGDTILANIDGEETRIRFIGIDTPESVNPDEDKNTEEGKEASAYTKELLTDHAVYLEYDSGKEDDYGRTLAYVYLTGEDGTTVMVNDLILKKGYARTMTIEPNVRYASHFAETAAYAQAKEKGFWGTGFFLNESGEAS